MSVEPLKWRRYQIEKNTDLWEAKEGFITRLGDIPFRPLLSDEEDEFDDIFITSAKDYFDLIKEIYEHDPDILKAINNELVRIGKSPAETIDEALEKLDMTEEELYEISSIIEDIINKGNLPFYSLPFTLQRLVEYIVYKLADFYGEKPKELYLPVSNEYIDISSDVVGLIGEKEIRNASDPKKYTNVIVGILKELSVKEPSIKPVAEKVENLFPVPLFVSELFDYGGSDGESKEK